MSSVLTVQMIMTLRATSCTTPGRAYHHTIVAIAASRSSTTIPAAETAIRRHLLGKCQAALTSQYKHGENTSNMKPISCTSPPKRLHVSACPSSCSTLTPPIATKSHGKFRQSTSALSAGSRLRNSSKCPKKIMSAHTSTANAGMSETGENSQPNSLRMNVSTRSGSMPGKRMPNSPVQENAQSRTRSRSRRESSSRRWPGASTTSRPDVRSRLKNSQTASGRIVWGENRRLKCRCSSAMEVGLRSQSISEYSSADNWKCSSVSGSFTIHVVTPDDSTGDTSKSARSRMPTVRSMDERGCRLGRSSLLSKNHSSRLSRSEPAVAIVDLRPHADLPRDRIYFRTHEDDLAVECLAFSARLDSELDGPADNLLRRVFGRDEPFGFKFVDVHNPQGL